MRRFTERYGTDPAALVRAPGRVNIIGEHTDYNDGFVLPAAIDRAVWIALAPSDVVEATSEGFDGVARFRLGEPAERVAGWGAYLQGVAEALGAAGHGLVGWRGAIASDVPVGAGLSSSAAIELAAAKAFHMTSGFAWDPPAIARVCQRAENEWVGLRSGIMDQMACAAGRAGHAVLLDCRSQETTLIRIPDGTALVVLDTGTRRDLTGSAYNDRRRECEEAAWALGVRSLRDVDAEAVAGRGETAVLRRARHVVTENARTLEAAAAMRAGRPERVGALMTASHESLRTDFEVSSAALDALVGAATAADGCFGARLTGGGFAGCVIALVAEEHVDPVIASATRGYAERTGRVATAYVCAAADGASEASVGR